MLAGAVFLFTLATRDRDAEPEDRAEAELPTEPPEQVEVKPPRSEPRSWSPGARSPLAAPPPGGKVLLVEDCLQQWWMLDPALSGELVVELEQGAGGLEATVLDHDSLPERVELCLASAIHGLDRPVSQEPTWQERFPFPGG